MLNPLQGIQFFSFLCASLCPLCVLCVSSSKDYTELTEEAQRNTEEESVSFVFVLHILKFGISIHDLLFERFLVF
jgi:hypothetical protein